MNKLTLGLICLWICEVEATSFAATNGVPLRNGWVFGITDYHLKPPGWEYKHQLLHDDEIDSRNYIGFIITNQRTNPSPVLMIPRPKGLSVELFDATNRRVEKTQLGKERCVIPPEVKRSRGLIRLRQDDTDSRVIGTLSELFKVKEPGIYTLQAVMYFYDATNGVYQRRESPPVRIPVIVEINAPSPPKPSR